MKRFLLFAMTGSIFLLGACNDNSSSTASGETDTIDTTTKSSMSNVDAPVAATDNNMMTKRGLPLGSDQGVPVNNSKASGTADITYNKDSHMLTYTVNWSGLTDKPIMAHIHGTAPKGVNAGVKKDLTGVLSKTVAGNFTDSVKIDGSGIKEDSLLSGFYYINIHTPKNPGGEIRGQITF